MNSMVKIISSEKKGLGNEGKTLKNLPEEWREWKSCHGFESEEEKEEESTSCVW